MPLSGAVSVEVVQRADAAGQPVYWANRWEIGSSFGGAGLDPEAVAQAFANFHRTALTSNFFVDYVRLSTYAPDSATYDPEALYVLPIGLRGTRITGDDTLRVLPLTNVLHLRKLVGSGRLGHVFLRGFLTEIDIQSDPNGGAVSITNQPAVQTYISAQYASLAAALGSGASISMISGSGLVLQERNVTGLSVAGVTSRRFTTRRKSRLVANSLSTIAGTLLGGVTLDEVPGLVEGTRVLARALGVTLPGLPLLPG